MNSSDHVDEEEWQKILDGYLEQAKILSQNGTFDRIWEVALGKPLFEDAGNDGCNLIERNYRRRFQEFYD